MKKTLVLLLLILSAFSVYNCEAKVLFKNDSEVSMTNEVRASHILVNSKEQAEQLKEAIQTGKITFAEAAEQYSKCPSGQQGGDLGYFGHGMMVPEFDKVSFELPVGVVSEPIQTQFGWHLIIVTDKR